MRADAIAKRVAYIFMLCLFSGLCPLGYRIFVSINQHYFSMEIPIFTLLVIAESVLFWLAFRADSPEKALKQINTLKIFALALAAYCVYSVDMYLVRAIKDGFHLIPFWYQAIANFCALCASLAVYFAVTTLKTGNTQKFNLASAVLLFIAAALVLGASVAVAILSKPMLVPGLMAIVLLIVLFAAATMLPKDRLLRGAVIGSISAGYVGALMGAITAGDETGVH